ncbi:MAG TPA: DUF4397 domain-containing protein [Terriglobales bacterium]|jgi:hypothetical protein|nr:DUF4397 domain-containing protein [Terriglobales bacterium]
MRGKLSTIFPFVIALICLSSLLLAAGCGSSKARYRFMQTATGLPTNSVDLQVDGKSVQTAIGFAQTATYHSSSSGNRKFDVFPNGSTTNAIVSQSVNLGSGDTTLLLQNTALNSNFVMSPYTDDNTAPTTGNAKVRIIHSSFSANPVDVYILTGNDISGFSPSIGNVAFQQATNYQVLASGTYNVSMTVAGTQNILNGLFNFSLTLTAGQIRTLVIVDSSFGGGPFSIVQLNDLN